MTGFTDNVITCERGGIKPTQSDLHESQTLQWSQHRDCAMSFTSEESWFDSRHESRLWGHPASNSTANKRAFPSGLIRSQHKAHHPPRPTANVNACSHTFTPPPGIPARTRATFTSITVHVLSFLYSTDFCTGLNNGCNSNYNFHDNYVTDSVNSAQPPKRQTSVVIILITLNNTL